MRVIWLPQAKQQVRQRAIYIHKMFGSRVRQRFLDEVREASNLLGRNPNAGKMEPLLKDFPGMYRSYVMNYLNKIVYHLCEDTIEVVAFWDTRREPAALTEDLR